LDPLPAGRRRTGPARHRRAHRCRGARGRDPQRPEFPAPFPAPSTGGLADRQVRRPGDAQRAWRAPSNRAL